MIGMQDDMRFLTGSRHEQLLGEAETRRLAAPTTDEDGHARESEAGTIERLRSRLLGSRRAATVAVRATDTMTMIDSLPTPRAMDRTSAASGCSGTCADGHAVAA